MNHNLQLLALEFKLRRKKVIKPQAQVKLNSNSVLFMNNFKIILVEENIFWEECVGASYL